MIIYSRRLLLYSTFVLLAALSLAAQTPVALSPVPVFYGVDQNGVPLAFGCVFTYQSGTTTPLTTYSDYLGKYANSNPVILNASGMANIWIQTGQAYTFVEKSAGGTNCSLGTTMYSVDGIGGGGTQLTTAVTPSGGSATFTDQAQNQLFTLTLTGNVTSLPMTATGIISPGIVTFQISQDGAGNHTFAWPSNVSGGVAVCLVANCVTQESFIWNGSTAIAIGSASYSTPANAVENLYDFGLSASSIVCVNSTYELASGPGCNSVFAITVNGQSIPPGGSGNVNNGAAQYSLAVNEGAGNALHGVALGVDQLAMGNTGTGDPQAVSVPDCATLSYASHAFACGATAVQSYARQELSSDVTVSAGTSTTLTSKSMTMPSSGCPCRALIAWNIGIQTSNAGGFSAAVTDGTNLFAFGQANATGSVGGNTQVGIQASGWSRTTYGNNANVTFTLKTESVDTGYTVKQAAGEGLVQNSGMDITIFPSN